MRIGVVTTSFPRSGDDFAGLFVREHVDWLRGQGHQVDVVAAGPGQGGAGVHWIEGGRLFSRRYGGAPEILEHEPSAWASAAAYSGRLGRHLVSARAQWDATIAHWLVPSGLCAALTTRGPLVAIAHSGDVAAIERTRTALPVAMALWRRGADIVFVSQALRDRFVARVPRPLRRAVAARCRVSPMGVDVVRFASARLPRPTGRAPRVMFLGRLVAIKGVEHLIDAVAELGDSEPVQLCIAGEGPAREALAEHARRRRVAAEFCGAVAPRDRHRLLAGADVVVVPSVRVRGRSEGTPAVALEAIAAGAQLVVSATGGLAELPPELALQVRPGDASALARGIRRALRQPPAAGARSRFLRRIDWSSVGPALLPRSVAAVRKSLRGA